MRNLHFVIFGCLLTVAYARPSTAPASEAAKTTAPADAPVDNTIQEIYGGPFNDLAPASQERARKFVGDLISKFQELGSGSQAAAGFFEAQFLPVVKQLETGTKSERKVFTAARDICRAFDYVVKINRTNAAWDDLHLNKILGKAANSNDPVVMSVAIEKLFMDFLKVASPSNPELPKMPAPGQ